MCEKQEEYTRQVNVEATAHICAQAKEIGAYVIHISTDYIFDGTAPPYTPEAGQPNPLNKYGQSKLDAELAVRASGCNSGGCVRRHGSRTARALPPRRDTPSTTRQPAVLAY